MRKIIGMLALVFALSAPMAMNSALACPNSKKGGCNNKKKCLRQHGQKSGEKSAEKAAGNSAKQAPSEPAQTATH